MARPVRMNYPETFYHILSRGNEKKEIFQDEKDYQKFLSLLSEVAERFSFEIHAYVLMKNHYHLLVKTREANLSKAIQWLGVSYSVWYNWRHQRSGHLFQGRFKSFLIENERYFGAMCLYIHGNPLRAGVVERLEDYPWSSYVFYANQNIQCSWLKKDLVLSLYGGSPENFVKEQKAFLEKRNNLLNNLHHGLYLGNESFAEECKRLAEKERHREKPQFRALWKDDNLQDRAIELLKALGEKDPYGLLNSPRVRSKLRDIAIYLLYQSGMYRNAEIGIVFGIGYTAISEAAKRGKKYFAEEREFLPKI